MFRLTLIFLVIWTALCTAVPAFAGGLSNITLTDSGEQTHITIKYDGVVSEPRVFTLDGGAPRVVIDLPDAVANGVKSAELQPKGAAKGVRYAPRGEGARVVIDMAEYAQLSGYTHSGTHTIVTLRLPIGAQRAEVTTAPIRTGVSGPRISAGGIPIPRLKPHSSEPDIIRKKVIVIDPGHGGYDPGALGKGGTKEKSVTLRAAKELKKQLEKTGRYSVVLTRDTDVFVELDERVRRARRAKADLFISLHADSAGRSTTRGASVYTIADHARKRSTRLVNSQNWILDVDLNSTPKDVDDILVDLAQRKTFSQSSAFADILVPELAKVTPVLGNTHRRAGLFVLLAPDVPAVLIEMGFLSNGKDEKLLNSAADRRRKMGAVVKSIDRYFTEVEK